jgi:hypothetical protein
LLIVDGEPGVFDETVRKLATPSLQEVLRNPGRGKVARMNALDYHQQRLLGQETETLEAMGRLVAEQGVAPEFVVQDASGGRTVGVETHTFRNGGVRIVGLHGNPQLRVNELGPPEFQSNERFEKPRTVRLKLPDEMYGYDLRQGKALGVVREVEVELDPYEPAIFAFTPSEFPALEVSAPKRLRRGDVARVGIAMGARSAAATHVFHVEVSGPDGKPASQYSGNLVAPGGRTMKELPTALNDAVGRWTVQVTDRLSGQQTSVDVEFY